MVVKLFLIPSSPFQTTRNPCIQGRVQYPNRSSSDRLRTVAKPEPVSSSPAASSDERHLISLVCINIKLVLANEREARRKKSSTALLYLNLLGNSLWWWCLANNTATNTNAKSLEITSTTMFKLFGCPEDVKMTIFKDPHVRLIFDRQTTDFLLKNWLQNAHQNHWIWVSIFIICLLLIWTSISTILSPKCSPKWYPKLCLFWNLRPC